MKRKGYTPDPTNYDLYHFQVNYRDGQNWQDCDTRRAFRVLRDHYRDFDAEVLPTMRVGTTITTTFSDYRLID